MLLLAGARAVLLQLAHPLVAAGVQAHSAYGRDPLGRFRRTFDLTQAIVFGTRTDALHAARTINQRHQQVRGTLDTAAGGVPSGTAYQARDPDLLLWVHATLIDTLLRCYPLVVAPLAPAEQEQYYRESLQTVRLLGLPAARCPPTLAAFQQYLHTMLSGDQLADTPAASKLASLVLHPPGLTVAWPLFDAAAIITVGLLPARLREMYRYPWGHRQQQLFDVWVQGTRRILPQVPLWLREFPAARSAEARVVQALNATQGETRPVPGGR